MEKRLVYMVYLCVFFVIDFFVLNHFTIFGLSPFYLLSVRLTFFISVLILFFLFVFDGRRYMRQLAKLFYTDKLSLVLKKVSMSAFSTTVKEVACRSKDFFRAEIVIAIFSDDIAKLVSTDSHARVTVIDMRKMDTELNMIERLHKKRWRFKKIGSLYFILDSQACHESQSQLRAAAKKIQAWLCSNKVKINISVLYVSGQDINVSFCCRNSIIVSQAEFINHINRDMDKFSEHCFESDYHAVLSSQQVDKNKKRLLSAIQLRRMSQEIKRFFQSVLNLDDQFSLVRSVAVDFIPSLNKASLAKAISHHRSRLSGCGYSRALFYVRNTVILCASLLMVFLLAYSTHLLINNKNVFLQQDHYWESELKDIPMQTNIKSYFSAISNMTHDISHFLLLHHLTVLNTSLLSSGLVRLEHYRIVHHIYPAFIDQLFPKSVKANLSYAEVYQYIAAMIVLTHPNDPLKVTFLPYALLLENNPRFNAILAANPTFVLQELYSLSAIHPLSESQRIIFHYLIDNLFSANSNELVLAVMQNEYAVNQPRSFYFSQDNFKVINQQSVITAYQKMRHINQILQNTYHLINVHFDLPNAETIRNIFKKRAAIYWQAYLNQRVDFNQIQSYQAFLCDHINYAFLQLKKEKEYCRQHSLAFSRSLLTLEPQLQRFNDELEINKNNMDFLHQSILSVQAKSFSLFNQMDSLAANTIKPLSDSIDNHKISLLKKLITYYLQLVSKQMTPANLKKYAFDIDFKPLLKLLPAEARLITRLMYLKTVDQLFYPVGSPTASCQFSIESLSLDSRLLDIKLIGPGFHYDYAHGPSTQMLLSTNPLQADYQITLIYRLQNGMQVHKRFVSKTALLQFFRYLHFYGCKGDVCHVSFHFHSYYWNFKVLFHHIQHPRVLFSTINRRTS